METSEIRSLVRGTVLDQTSGTPLSGCRVEAWDHARKLKDMVLVATTDDGGGFRMELADAHKELLFGDAPVTLYFRVLDGASTDVLFEGRGQSLWRPDQRATDVTLRVRSGRPVMQISSLASATVRGTLSDAAGPMPGTFVRAYDETLGTLTPLGPAVATDSRGGFRISYDPMSIPNGKERPDLVVRAGTDVNLSAVIAESERVCRAPAAAVVHLVRTGHTWRGAPRYTHVMSALTSRIGAQAYSSLDEAKRNSLACSAGLEADEVHAFVAAHLLSVEFETLTREVAYGAIRRGIPGDRDRFFKHGKSVLREALRAAVAANDVSQLTESQIEDVLTTQWLPVAAAWALSPRTTGTAGLGEILNAADIPDESTRGAFAQSFCAHEGTPAQFWSQLTGLTTTQKGRVQLAMQQWSLMRGFDPLLQHLKSLHGTYPTMESLAALDEAGWTAMLDLPAVGVPSSIPGSSDAEKKANYAKVLYRTVAAAFPTRTFVHRASALESGEINGFFLANPTFEFGETRLTRTDTSALSATAKKRLKGMERMFKLIPRYEEVKALVDAGYESAHAISEKGEGKFVSQAAAWLGEASAQAVYQKACWQVGASNVLYSKYASTLNAQNLAVLADWKTQASPEDPNNAIPDWADLFGSPAGCTCKPCASVLSAAAYLADLLQWLSRFDSEVEKAAGTKWSALDVLVGKTDAALSIAGRRPDLEDLELTCKSSHTPLPYIDLTNEILEVAVDAHANNHAPAYTSPVKTSYDAEDLLAGPEIVHPAAHIGAWKALNAARHSFSLPFDPWAQEANAYLRYLGVSRKDLVDALLAPSASATERDVALTKAEFGLRPLGYALLTEQGLPLDGAWGGKTAADFKGVGQLPMFLKYAGLSFEGLTELFATRYVAVAQGLAPLVLTPENGCDVAKMEIPALTDAHLARIHPFLRLASKLQVSLTDLDRVLRAFSTADDAITLDATRLHKAVRAKGLADRLSLPITDVAAFYGDLDAREAFEEKSPYRTAFLNRRVDSPEAKAFNDLLVPANNVGLVNDHRVSLQQALSLSADDFDLLTNDVVLAARLFLPAATLVVSGGAQLTLESVSKLYRVVRFARALKLPIADYLVLAAHAGFAPIGAAVLPESTEAFCELVRDVRDAKLPVSVVQHVLRSAAPAAQLAPKTADVEALRSALSEQVDVLMAETESSEDVDGARAARLLFTLFSPSEAAAIRDTLSGENVVPASLAPLVPYVDVSEATLKDMLAGQPTSSPVVPPALASSEARYSYAAKWLDRFIRAERALSEKLAGWCGVDPMTVKYLLTAVLKSPASGSRSAIDDFMPARRADLVGGENHVATWQTSTLLLLDRHAKLIRQLRIAPPIAAGPDGAPAADVGELKWVYDDTTLGTSLRNVPVSVPAPDYGLTDAQAAFGVVLGLVRRVALRDRLSPRTEALRRVIAEMPDLLADAVSFLSEQTGWDKDAVAALAGRFGISNGGGLKNDANLLRIERAIRLLAVLRLPPSEAFALTVLDAPEPDDLTPSAPNATKNARDLVLIARRAAKANVSAEQWAEVARGVRNPFREALRDALMGYLVPRVYPTVSRAFGSLLIDPEMSACQKTSRVVQATNSLQVFVERSFLGLDDEVKLPAEAASTWAFLKSYRVWEANRKVFLYPENWLDPELRDDKTPLFKAFESKLRQGEINEASAERALEAYLSGLDEIARPESMATCVEEETDTTHVVARTRGLPRKWLYRRHTPSDGWSPWAPMNIEVDGESLLLTAENRRLYLFWPQLSVRPQEDQGAPAQDSESPAEPLHRFDIRLAWSCFVDGAWSAKRLSDGRALSLAPARGEMGGTGFGPEHIALAAAPFGVASEGQVGVSVLVRYTEVFYATDYVRAGDFVLDPCGGGRWSMSPRVGEVSFKDLAKGFYEGMLPDGASGMRFFPELPSRARLSGRGVEEMVFAGESHPLVSVPRPVGVGGGSPSTVLLPILANHPGGYRILAASSPTWPLVRYDRFVIEDGHRSLFGRVDRTYTFGELTEASKAFPAGLADIPGFDPNGDVAAAWAENAIIDVPQSMEIHDTVTLAPFDHPFVCDFSRALAEDGISGLLGWRTPVPGASTPQFLSVSTSADYGDTPVPNDQVELTWGGAYSAYNWELFFHVPFFIATRLSAEGRHEEAQKWFHYIFDPTADASAAAAVGARRFWKFRPFYENDSLATIQTDLETLALASSTAAEVQAFVDQSNAVQTTVKALEAQIAALLEKPFNPHAIGRYRILAYQKAVVMRYIDNLVDWADALFRRGTLEANHEALSLYLLASDLLGPRPETLTHKGDPDGMTFAQLRDAGLDAFANAAVAAEAVVPVNVPKGWACKANDAHTPNVRTYFCVPNNDALLAYWDRVADRLFKLRNCLDIDGARREVPLFTPPIDPAILVKATAAGVSLDQVLDALAAPAPLFRFLRLHAKAMEMASNVAGLGQAVLSAMERKDGEALSRLRQTHELALLDAERESRKMAIAEAREGLSGLVRQRQVVERREEFYRTIRDRLPEETEAKQRSSQAKDSTLAAGIADGLSSALHAIPDLITTAGMSPSIGVKFGGQALGYVAGAVGRGYSTDASLSAMSAGMLQTEAGYLRRREEWRLAQQLAARELRQIDKLIAAQEIRIALAEHEAQTLELRTAQSQEVDEFLRTRFAGQDLYDWMVRELAAEHYRAYQVAYDMAKKAERAFRLERGDDTISFVRFGAWDSLKKGLLAGERLMGDLRAMDAAYLSRTDREREIIKHISLATVVQDASEVPNLVALRDTGVLEAEIPEWLFDADYPGHFFRRIKAVSVTVPVVHKAQDGVQCEVALVNSRFRKTPLLTGGYDETGVEDGRFQRFSQAVEAISTSTADDDPGQFQLDLMGEKLLPYEGAGAVGRWRFEVPKETNRFHLRQIADAVLHLRYTSRDAGEPFRAAALGAANIEGRRRVLVVPASTQDPAWQRFSLGESDGSKHKLEMAIVPEPFWSFFGARGVKIVEATVSMTFGAQYDLPGAPATLQATLTPPGFTPAQALAVSILCRAGEPSDTKTGLNVPVLAPSESGFAPWILEVQSGTAIPIEIRDSQTSLLKPGAIEDVWLSFTYEKAE